jgi:RNA polymerase sigma-70 factor (ECF subfamily)
LSAVDPEVHEANEGVNYQCVGATTWLKEQAMKIDSIDAGRAKGNAASTPVDLEHWSEGKLIAAAKNGHGAAFGVLCERHAEMILRVTFRITHNKEDAEDAVQDSFMSAFIHLTNFDERSRFATWLTRIAINSALGQLRKKRGIREIPMDEPNPASESIPRFEIQDRAPNPEENYRIHERREIVGAAIGRLRPRSRKVVEVHQLGGFSVKETAQILGISIAAAKARMFHARVALRRMPMLRSVRQSNWSSAG